jgi:beta-galactosidase
LQQKDAEEAWKVQAGGTIALVSTPQQAFVDGALVTLQNLGGKTFEANVIPEGALRAVAANPGIKLGHSGADVTFTSPSTVAASVAIAVNQTKQPGEVAPLPDGFVPSGRPRVVAAGPTAQEWRRAGVWNLTLPKTVPAAGERQFLQIKYVGDVMRLSAGGKLLDDNFADGRPWLVGLTRFMPQLEKNAMELSIYPLRKDAPIFFEPGLEPKVDGTQAVGLESVELVTEFSLKLKMEVGKGR